MDDDDSEKIKLEEKVSELERSLKDISRSLEKEKQKSAKFVDEKEEILLEKEKVLEDLREKEQQLKDTQQKIVHSNDSTKKSSSENRSASVTSAKGRSRAYSNVSAKSNGSNGSNNGQFNTASSLKTDLNRIKVQLKQEKEKIFDLEQENENLRLQVIRRTTGGGVSRTDSGKNTHETYEKSPALRASGSGSNLRNSATTLTSSKELKSELEKVKAQLTSKEEELISVGKELKLAKSVIRKGKDKVTGEYDLEFQHALFKENVDRIASASSSLDLANDASPKKRIKMLSEKAMRLEIELEEEKEMSEKLRNENENLKADNYSSNKNNLQAGGSSSSKSPRKSAFITESSNNIRDRSNSPSYRKQWEANEKALFKKSNDLNKALEKLEKMKTAYNSERKKVSTLEETIVILESEKTDLQKKLLHMERKLLDRNTNVNSSNIEGWLPFGNKNDSMLSMLTDGNTNTKTSSKADYLRNMSPGKKARKEKEERDLLRSADINISPSFLVDENGTGMLSDICSNNHGQPSPLNISGEFFADADISPNSRYKRGYDNRNNLNNFSKNSKKQNTSKNTKRSILDTDSSDDSDWHSAANNTMFSQNTRNRTHNNISNLQEKKRALSSSRYQSKSRKQDYAGNISHATNNTRQYSASPRRRRNDDSYMPASRNRPVHQKVLYASQKLFGGDHEEDSSEGSLERIVRESNPLFGNRGKRGGNNRSGGRW